MFSRPPSCGCIATRNQAISLVHRFAWPLYGNVILCDTSYCTTVVIRWVTPRVGSIAGGTVVDLQGSEFATDAFTSSNIVWLEGEGTRVICDTIRLVSLCCMFIILILSEWASLTGKFCSITSFSLLLYFLLVILLAHIGYSAEHVHIQTPLQERAMLCCRQLWSLTRDISFLIGASHTAGNTHH